METNKHPVNQSHIRIGEINMQDIKRQGIDGFLKSPEAASFLGLTESQFRKRQSAIKSIQVHERGMRLYKLEDLQAFKLKK